MVISMQQFNTVQCAKETFKTSLVIAIKIWGHHKVSSEQMNKSIELILIILNAALLTITSKEAKLNKKSKAMAWAIISAGQIMVLIRFIVQVYGFYML